MDKMDTDALELRGVTIASSRALRYLTKTCAQKCINPKLSLTTPSERKCLQNCVPRFMDSYVHLMDKLQERIEIVVDYEYEKIIAEREKNSTPTK
mmetsp:Transcript_59175/g.67365  ORF Transcript_59175/g.67365 Transcript_59175/m.67365 type:complete len:95 (-) Transcript_59175:155-439(-)